MIGYCPLDDDPIERPRPSQKVPVPVPVQERRESPTGGEDTECNYVVLFFIAGVIALAIMDTLPRK
jgi:hypothetical protein|tara:strand:+ start:37 stop:234 length:198 start_codon:yes stop_codon:yes gene_type:complete